MQNERIRINYNNFIFELNFKTQHSLEMSATDPISYRKYQNKNVQFSKIPKSSIIASLLNKNPKELKCTISQQFLQQLEQKKQQDSLIKQKCLRLHFLVEFEYIQPFSQTTILYEIKNHRQLDKIIPKKLSNEDIREVQRSLAQIETALPTGQQSPEEMFQYHQISNLPLTYDRIKQERAIIYFIVFNFVNLVGYVSYFTFYQFLAMILLSVGILAIYFRSQKFTIKSIKLKRGSYKISISGHLTVQDYGKTPSDSFVIHLQLNRFTSQKLKLYINSMNCYAYPFSGTLMVESKKEQEVEVRIQKNVKFYPTSLQNILITVDKVSNFSSSS